MSDKDDFIDFIKAWAKNFVNRNGPPEYFNLERGDPYENWSQKVLSIYDKGEGKNETDDTIAFVEKVTSDVLSYLDEAEGSKKTKEKRR